MATLVFVPAVFAMLHRGNEEGTTSQPEHEQQPQHA
jgi:hypothetical protein